MTLQIGEVQTLAPGIDAYVQNTGTDDNIVLNFGIPAGEKGEQGIQGEPGADGAPGKDGKDGTSAGFGTITATVDETTGTPTVDIETSGTNEAKNITFAFSGLKGEEGQQGLPGESVSVKALSDCENIVAESGSNGINLTWTDPDNLVFNDQTVAEWAGTKVVRKEGAKPTSVTDGVVVADSTVKDAHKTSPLVDTGAVTGGAEYNYLLCPYTTEGVVTESDFSRVMVVKSSLNPVLDKNKWDDIIPAIESGENIWLPGDKKKLPLSGTLGVDDLTGNHYAEIVGINHDKVYSDESLPTVTFRIYDLFKFTYRNMQADRFDYLPVQSLFYDRFDNVMTAKVVPHVKTIKKKYKTHSGTMVTTSSKYFAPSIAELGAVSSVGDGVHYDYITPSNRALKYKDASVYSYMTRSPYISASAVKNREWYSSGKNTGISNIYNSTIFYLSVFFYNLTIDNIEGSDTI